ncbi:hypothetical protein ACF061_12475 [Streptomyces sp. NPDC015220]|uniref:hypothetical protein n=1 Tax=Streptomyces sp. NPDC015220 TaxID=3364947 RepID=UPI00370151B0
MRSDRLRFVEDPLTAVGFPGTGKRTSTSRSERGNLPDKVVAGEEYRDASVTYRLATRLTGPPENGRDRQGGGEGEGGGEGGDDTNARTSPSGPDQS